MALPAVGDARKSMKITAIRETTVSLSANMRNAGIAYDAMTASAVVVETDATVDGQPLTGFGFDSIGRYAHGALLQERFIPRLANADPALLLDASGQVDPTAGWSVMMANEKPGGHGERAGAVGVLDMALWDLRAKQRRQPAWQTIADYYGRTGDPRVSLYTSGGHYAENPADTESLVATLKGAREAGHRRFKIKIGGAALDTDCQRIEAALAVAGDGNLAVDANGVWDPETASEWLGSLEDYPLAWIEEPVSPLDYAGLATVSGRHATPIGTGENLFSYDDARNLLRHGGLRANRDWLQFDVSLSYGLPEFERILRLYEDNGWSGRRFAPHAGHLLGLHTVAGLNLGMAETAMDRTMAIAACPDGSQIEDGAILLPDLPGFGVEHTPPILQCFDPLLGR